MDGNPMVVLGIETTCDETAAAVVERPPSGPGRILSNVVLSQIDEHAAFGGVVPEIAARAHVEALDLIIAQAMKEAGVSFAALDDRGRGLVACGLDSEYKHGALLPCSDDNREVPWRNPPA